MELLVIIALAGACFALLPLALELLAALIGIVLQALLRLLGYALERAGEGFRWGMSDGLDATWRTGKRIAGAIGDAAKWAYAAVSIFIEEWKISRDPEALARREAERRAYEQAMMDEFDRRSREAFEEMQAKARAQEEARAREEWEREQQRQQEARQRAEEERRRQQQEQARAKARAGAGAGKKSAPPSPYEQALALLGLKAGFTQDDLKRAFRARIKAAHPDAGGSTEAAAALNAAYELLKKRTAA